MDRLRQMQVFAHVAKHRSLVQTAYILNITPAAVSKQLTRLEEDLGVVLLERSTRKIELTPIGERYLRQCQRVIAEAQEAEAVVLNEHPNPHGPIRVVSSRYFAAYYIVPHIKEFLKRYPDVELIFEISERIPNMVEEGVDVLIGMTARAPEGCKESQIMASRHVICASPDYFKQHGMPSKPEELRKHRYINHSMRTPPDSVPLKGGKRISVEPFMVVNDSSAMVDIALQGLGIIMMQYHVIAKHLKAGRLQEVLQEFIEPVLPINVAFPPRRNIPRAAQCFVDFVREKCQEHDTSPIED